VPAAPREAGAIVRHRRLGWRAGFRENSLDTSPGWPRDPGTPRGRSRRCCGTPARGECVTTQTRRDASANDSSVRWAFDPDAPGRADPTRPGPLHSETPERGALGLAPRTPGPPRRADGYGPARRRCDPQASKPRAILDLLGQHVQAGVRTLEGVRLSWASPVTVWPIAARRSAAAVSHAPLPCAGSRGPGCDCVSAPPERKKIANARSAPRMQHVASTSIMSFLFARSSFCTASSRISRTMGSRT
jgi:hypothetical protein